MKLIWGPLATEDLRSIWHYIAIDDAGAADAWLDRIVEKAELLRSQPRLGPESPHLSPAIRSIRIGRYRLYDRPSSDRIDIIRVLHGARDLSGLSFD